jgi:hypothetical protein
LSDAHLLVSLLKPTSSDLVIVHNSRSANEGIPCCYLILKLLNKVPVNTSVVDACSVDWQLYEAKLGYLSRDLQRVTRNVQDVLNLILFHANGIHLSGGEYKYHKVLRLKPTEEILTRLNIKSVHFAGLLDVQNILSADTAISRQTESHSFGDVGVTLSSVIEASIVLCSVSL